MVAAKNRQQSAKTIAIEFKKIEVIPKGAISEMATGLPFKQAGLVPAKETTLESVNRLVIDGDKVRYENNHPAFHMPDGNVIDKGNVSLFNGTIATGFFPKGMGSRTDTPFGAIKKQARHDEVKSMLLYPITMTFRGLDPGISEWLISEMTASGVTLPIGGTSCQEYVVEASPGFSISCWIDPSRGYVIRRIRTQRRNQLQHQLDIRYQEKSTNLWVPASWESTEFSSTGSVGISQKVEILQLRLNEPQPAEQFESRFPPGAEVSDQRNGKMYRIQPDGSMREFSLVTGEESGATLAQPGESWYRRNKWLLVSVGIAVVTAVCFAIFRRKKDE